MSAGDDNLAKKLVERLAHPEAGLVMSGNTLNGTTALGGIFIHGTMFSLTLH